MAQKYYDDFSRLTVEKMAQAMEDLTYLYNETQVPKKHYKEQLTKPIEEMIETSVEMNLIDTYYRTIEQLLKNNPKWLFQAMLCLDMGVKPSSIKPSEYQALEMTWVEFNREKKAKTVDSKWLDCFTKIKENGTTITMEIRNKKE